MESAADAALLLLHTTTPAVCWCPCLLSFVVTTHTQSTPCHHWLGFKLQAFLLCQDDGGMQLFSAILCECRQCQTCTAARMWPRLFVLLCTLSVLIALLTAAADAYTPWHSPAAFHPSTFVPAPAHPRPVPAHSNNRCGCGHQHEPHKPLRTAGVSLTNVDLAAPNAGDARHPVPFVTRTRAQFQHVSVDEMRAAAGRGCALYRLVAALGCVCLCAASACRAAVGRLAVRRLVDPHSFSAPALFSRSLFFPSLHSEHSLCVIWAQDAQPSHVSSA